MNELYRGDPPTLKALEPFRDEMLICREPDLAHLDQQLATLYREQFGKVPRERQDEFQRHESLFLHARRKCSEDYRCIDQSYRNRIKELEDFLSEAQREETTGTAPSADANSERPVESRDRRSTRSETDWQADVRAVRRSLAQDGGCR